MSRAETLLSLLAVILASVAAFPIHGRLLFAFAAIILIAYVGVVRLRAALTQKRVRPAGFDPAERAAKIREERARRGGR